MNNIDTFIEQLLTDKKLPGMTDEVREELKKDLSQRLVEQIDRAVIEALPEEKAIELSEKIDNPNFTMEDAGKFVEESGVDMQKVALTTMLAFRNLYLGGGA